jgi:thiamine pyrophosphate-dependent acetolactate synthase large subunit-like protein
VAAFSQTVLPNSKHAELMSLALKTAIVERDVGHLIFPAEVQVLPVDDNAAASSPEGRIGPVEIVLPQDSLTAAVEKIAAAERPVIIVGYGAREGMNAVIELAGRLNAPVLTTFKAKGQISDRHPLASGVLGRSGTPIASLDDERGRPAGGLRRLVFRPHRYRTDPADYPGRLRPHGAGQVPSRRAAGVG